MIVILCHPDDGAALWLDRALRELGTPDVALVAVEQFVFSRHIVHRLNGSGDSGLIELADGRALHPHTIAGLINRIRYLPTQHFAPASEEDRTYATCELSAFMLAWLNGVAGRVVNPARPMALGGGTLHAIVMRHAAATAGLSTTSWAASTESAGTVAEPTLRATHSVTVLDGRLFGPLLPRHIQDGCRRLAAIVGMPLMQVFLHRSTEGDRLAETGEQHGGEWHFVDATGHVDFRLGGKPLASALAKVLGA